MWLLKQDIADGLEHARKTHSVSADDRARWEASLKADDPKPGASETRIMSRAGKTAEIRVEGVLTKNRDILAWLFYGANTSYREILDSFVLAERDPNVKSIELYVDSPGGQVDGLFDVLGALQGSSKPIKVRVACACSAAYAIAAAPGGKIEATGPSASVGSIGVVVSYFNDEALIDITSTNAPNKRPDITTDEGKAVVREHLDAIHELFVDAIAEGRSAAGSDRVTAKDINETYGRGSVLLAKAAKQRGMIDSIANPKQGARKAVAASTVQSKKESMTEQELLAQHPELHASLLAKGKEAGVAEGRAAGIEEGEAKERKRVSAHLKMAETTGATKVAHDAIASGKSTMDEDVHAEYFSAALKRRDSDNSQADSDEAAAAIAGATAVAAETDLGDEIVAALEGKKDWVQA